MNELCIRDLTDLTGGTLHLGAMPPLAGAKEPLGEIRLQHDTIERGDVYWPRPSEDHAAEMYAEAAYMQGAAGVVITHRSLEPWAGTFCLQVDDPHKAMLRFASAMRQQFCGSVISLLSDEQELLGALCHTFLRERMQGSWSDTPVADPMDIAFKIAGLVASDEYTLLAQPFLSHSQKDGFSHLCSPDVAVITRTAMTEINPVANERQVQQATREALKRLPENGLVIVNATDAVLQDAARVSNAQVISIASDCGKSAVATLQATSDAISFEISHASFHVPSAANIRWETVAAAVTLGRELGISMTSMQAAWRTFQKQRTMAADRALSSPANSKPTSEPNKTTKAA